MPLEQKQTFLLPDGGCDFAYHKNWERSPRVNGKLVLQSNALQHLVNRTLKYRRDPTLLYAPKQSSFSDLQDEVGLNWVPMGNQVYARWLKQVRDGSKANLGVTAASWRQSFDMITKRFGHARNVLSARERGLLKVPQKRRPHATDSADTVLEVEFGWKSLFQDIHDAMKVLASDIPPQFVTKRVRASIFKEETTGTGVAGSPLRTTVWTGFASTSLSSKVEVTNHNLWLLNKLGLINPAAIVWDKIPWSFLVGMFVNANQLIGSYTDLVGLKTDNWAQTYLTDIKVSQSISHKGADWETGSGFSVVHARRRNRQVGTPPTVQTEWKLPTPNLELSLIAGSLLVQQGARLTRLLR